MASPIPDLMNISEPQQPSVKIEIAPLFSPAVPVSALILTTEGLEPSQRPQETATETGESLVPQVQEPEIDYSKIYEGLQERFNKVYSISQKLFITEKTQRQTLYYYKRRNDALLDLLCELEESDNEETDELVPLSAERISHIISTKPELEHILKPVLSLAEGEDASRVQVKDSYNVDLVVNESIPDIVNDELDTVEINPQDTEMWTRRNYAHLVISKFKPVEIRGKGVREYINSPTLNTKRRKKGTTKE